jgi:hypothetical protein
MWGRAKYRTGRWVLAVVLTSGALFGNGVAAALACDTAAYGGNWSPNCLVGYGYDTAANYITGIQRILKAYGYYGGSIDGYWGPLSHGATQNYQAARGLDADGIVGSDTWGALDDEFENCGVVGDYRLKRVRVGETCTTYSFKYNWVNRYWYIKRLNGTWEATFATWGPQ